MAGGEEEDPFQAALRMQLEEYASFEAGLPEGLRPDADMEPSMRLQILQDLAANHEMAYTFDPYDAHRDPEGDEGSDPEHEDPDDMFADDDVHDHSHPMNMERVFARFQFFARMRNHQDAVDVDNMSYEELSALGERIGRVSTGLKPDGIERVSTKFVFSEVEAKSRGTQGELTCTVCLCDFDEGDDVRLLKCRHLYHPSCIDRWLSDDRRCPVCKKEADDGEEAAPAAARPLPAAAASPPTQGRRPRIHGREPQRRGAPSLGSPPQSGVLRGQRARNRRAAPTASVGNPLPPSVGFPSFPPPGPAAAAYPPWRGVEGGSEPGAAVGLPPSSSGGGMAPDWGTFPAPPWMAGPGLAGPPGSGSPQPGQMRHPSGTPPPRQHSPNWQGVPYLSPMDGTVAAGLGEGSTPPPAAAHTPQHQIGRVRYFQEQAPLPFQQHPPTSVLPFHRNDHQQQQRQQQPQQQQQLQPQFQQQLHHQHQHHHHQNYHHHHHHYNPGRAAYFSQQPPQYPPSYLTPPQQPPQHDADPPQPQYQTFPIGQPSGPIQPPPPAAVPLWQAGGPGQWDMQTPAPVAAQAFEAGGGRREGSGSGGNRWQGGGNRGRGGAGKGGGRVGKGGAGGGKGGGGGKG
eukprot:Hpha_TRINITY_DN16903_c4_g1::TRINITY_DN16903_c4_g1_i1::g.53575::m.53575